MQEPAVLAVAAGALLTGVLLLALGALRRDAEPAPISRWVIDLPRGADFTLERAGAWVTALLPLLPTAGCPWVELFAEREFVRLRVAAPPHWEATLRGQLAAWCPEAVLRGEPEPAEPGGSLAQALGQEKSPLYPLRLARPGEPDPLIGILGVLAHETDEAGLRVTLAPAPAWWKGWAPAAADAARRGEPLPPVGWRYRLGLWLQPFKVATGAAEPRTNDPHRWLRSKASEPALSARVVAWAAGTSEERARGALARLVAAVTTATRDREGNALVPFGHPRFAPPSSLPAQAAAILSPREVAALFHVPAGSHPLVATLPSRVVPPPATLPPGLGLQPDVTVLGEALTKGAGRPFGLSRTDRRQHLYVVGQTGTGKSTLLAQIARQDMDAGLGLALIDPHGDLAETVLSYVPPGRAQDVAYFNPADTEFPVGLNLLAAASPDERALVASGIVSVFKRLYGESWGPRLEYLLRNAVIALLTVPDASLLILPKLLLDDEYRRRAASRLTDPILRSFFRDEFEQYDLQFRTQALSPILNKVGQFLAIPPVRNSIAQAAGGLQLPRLLQDGGILIANLSTGQIGEDASGLLGGLLVTGIQLAAMGRARLPRHQRRDFSLIVDEFQHFTTDSFATILSEARKYGLLLTVSHQYLDQVPAATQDAVFGNVGSLISFRVGQADTVRLVRELAPGFSAEDLVSLPNYRFAARITQAGTVLPAFSALSAPPAAAGTGTEGVVGLSRRRYARPRADVELEINDLWEGRGA